MKYSIVIPNYNGISLLKRFLPGMVEYAESNSLELIIIDDCSTDDSIKFISENYPQIRLLANSINLGFGGSCNKAIAAAAGEYVFLFNSDIEIKSIPLDIIETYLQQADFFAITFKSFYSGGEKFREGAKRLKIKNGLPFVLHNEKDQQTDSSGRQYSFYAVGGHALFQRQKFLELGGFSELYAPFYWEDSDLGYRALKMGWRTYFDPRLTVIHHHENSSIKSNFQNKKIRQIKIRNRIIFMYHNFSFSERLYKFYPGMLLRALESLVTYRFGFFVAWRAAVKKMKEKHA